MDDFPPTQQDILVKNELTDKINEELMHFEILVSSEIKAFNEQFNALKLNYLFIEEEK